MKKRHLTYIVLAFMLVFFIVIVNALSDFTVPVFPVNGLEDSFFIYNLTNNLSNSSWNEGLTFSVINVSAINYTSNFAGSGATLAGYPWIYLNSSTGILNINSTYDNQSALYNLWLVVTNSSGQSRGDSFYFNITPINDYPFFTNLTNQTFNSTFLFSKRFSLYDEENNAPFKINISFLNCTTAQWSDRNNSNCTLFSNYTFNQSNGLLNISFTPNRNDVGSYIINFTLEDSGNNWAPFNASYSQVANFTVNNINMPPIFSYLCNNERTATEEVPFNCFINISDIDETNNVTIQTRVNTSLTWFTFNSSSTSIVVIPINSSTMFNGSAFVNFTPSNQQVGNWTINVSANDTGNPLRTNFTTFTFSVLNVPDIVHLINISQVDIYTSNSYVLYINATDDDLLIPDKNVYFESLNFSSNNSLVSITGFQNITNTNISVAKISFNAAVLDVGLNYINISVNDRTGNYDSTILILNLSINNAPTWTPAPAVNFSLVESQVFFLNLSMNVSDIDNQALTFSYYNSSGFPSFYINPITGIINITPSDVDVGSHNVLINVSDGVSISSLDFTFIVNNTYNLPYIEPFANQEIFENNLTSFAINVFDNDFNIPLSQTEYYNETLNFSWIISGPNIYILNFSLSLSPRSSASQRNLSIYTTSFTPSKSDVGNYIINLSVKDISNFSFNSTFYMNITQVNNFPLITNISNQTSSIGRNLFLDINGSDLEDGNESSGNLTYSYSFLQGNDFILNNNSIFNSTTGILNKSFNSSQAGTYRINISLNDSFNKKSYLDMFILVYDSPVINGPTTITLINLTENNVSLVSFNVSHAINNYLNCSFYLNDELKTSFLNISVFNWSYSPYFNEETYENFDNLTLFVSNLIYPDLNSTRTWSTNISHSNAPVSFNESIPNYQKNYDQVVSIDLSTYFSDLDHTDVHHNQSIVFTVSTNATGINSSESITASVSNSDWQANFSASVETMELFNITASDSQYSNVSNFFSIAFTTPSTLPAVSSLPDSGSGGGGAAMRPISLKIITPGPLTSKKKDKLVLPVSVLNNGKVSFQGIVLRNSIAKNGLIRNDLVASFDKSFIPLLNPGDQVNLTLIVDVDTSDAGLYEINLNGTSTTPYYSDSAKIYLNVEESDTVEQKILFLEELIADNPQCIELKEMVDEAKKLLSEGKSVQAEKKVSEAIQACQDAIAQVTPLTSPARLYDQLINSTVIATIGAIGLGMGYYLYRRFKLKRSLSEIENSLSSKVVNTKV